MVSVHKISIHIVTIKAQLSQLFKTQLAIHSEGILNFNGILQTKIKEMILVHLYFL